MPPPFSDPDAERAFLHEYRIAGLGSLQHACALGIVAYLAMGCLDAIVSGWDYRASIRRMVAVSLLAATALLVTSRPQYLLRHYSLLLGSSGVLTIAGLVSVMHLFRESSAKELIAPVSLLALGILYGFGRLPLRVAALVGGIGSLFAIFGARLTNMSAPGARTFIYLLLANALGLLLARSIELRERRLFLQGRTAEEAQIELKRRTSLAETASAEKTRLIAAVGHDLRQPMLSAVLHTEVLIQRLNAQDLLGVRRQALRVEESVKIMGATLDHLITAARYEAGTDSIDIQTLLIRDVLHSLRELFEGQASAEGVDFNVNAPLSGAVTTDKTALLGVLTNLVSNALKFSCSQTKRRPVVIVKAIVRQDTCRIVVTDNGIGIPKAELETIWQPFYQVGNLERDRRRGLGLGLYIVKQSLARLEGHSVEVQSRVGKGSRFVVKVPIAIAGVADSSKSCNDSKAVTMPPLAHLNNLHVLLIEDDQYAREAIEAQFAEWQVSCSAGYCLEQALQSNTLKGMTVDVIVADFRLPGDLNGAQAIRTARVLLGYEPRAVLITAEVGTEALLKLLPPSTTYLKKPFGTSALRAALTDPA